MKKILITTLILIFILITFILSFWSHLSSEKLTNVFEHHANQELARNRIPIQLNLSHVQTTLRGIKIKKITVFEKSRYPKEILKVQVLKLNPVSFHLFELKIPFEFRMYRGKIKGKISIIKPYKIEFSAKNIYLTENPIIQNLKALNLLAKISLKGKMNLQLPLKGTLSLQSSRIVFNGEKIGFPLSLLPKTQFQVRTKITFKKQKIKGNLYLKGDLAGTLEGQLQPNYKNFKRSSYQVKIRGNIKGKFYKKLDFLLKTTLQGFEKKPLEYHLELRGNSFFQPPKVKKL
ncbi:MAG: hypothetical protein ACI86H_000229 [bacterium]|jgi:hypothetical protein